MADAVYRLEALHRRSYGMTSYLLYLAELGVRSSIDSRAPALYDSSAHQSVTRRA
jgi:hypothetical protein